MKPKPLEILIYSPFSAEMIEDIKTPIWTRPAGRLSRGLVCVIGLLMGGLLPCAAQSFRVESFQLDSQSRPRLSVPGDTNSYYRLLSGAELTNVQSVVGLSLSNTIVGPQPATDLQAFYRVQRVPLDNPLDSDGDGIDDVWEIERGLNPLLASDAGEVAPGDTRTWLEVYTDERAVTLVYQYAAGQESIPHSLAQDPISKAVYAAGEARGSDGVWHGLILKSTDYGINWATNPPLEDYSPGQFLGITTDPSGNLYAMGPGVLKSSDGGANWSLVDTNDSGPGPAASDRDGNLYVVVGSWVVRKYTVASNSWATVDDFQGAGYNWPTPLAIACDPTGGVFVVGTEPTGPSSGNGYAWVVRHSGDGGATWQTVDTVQLGANDETRANGVAADAKGNVYVVGIGFGNTGPAHWLVRASSDGGNSWKTIDDFTNPPGGADGIAVDGAGRLDVMGTVVDSNGVDHWLLRRSSDGGATWVNVDDFLYGDGSYNVNPEAALALPDGSVLVAGYAFLRGDLQSYRWLIRRLAPPPPQQ